MLTLHDQVLSPKTAYNFLFCQHSTNMKVKEYLNSTLLHMHKTGNLNWEVGYGGVPKLFFKTVFYLKIYLKL